jgi:hypothetical protein
LQFPNVADLFVEKRNMAIPKVNQHRWRRGSVRGCAVASLSSVVRTDGFASAAQRVRAASTLLEVGEFLSTEAKATGLFRDAEEADGADGRAAG